MDVNYYNFKKQVDLVTEMDLSIPGIKVKNAPETTIEDVEIIDGVESSDNIDVNLAEYKDERVNFLYDTDSSFVDGIDVQERKRGTEVVDLEDANGDPLIQYPDDGSPATLTVNGSTLPIRPAHQFMQDDGYSETSRKVLLERIWLAGCGFWPNYGYNLRKFIQYDNSTKRPIINNSNTIPTADNKANGWISHKEFKQRIDSLRNTLKPLGIDIIVNRFEKSVDINGVDLNDSGISRKRDKRFSNVYQKAQSFLTKRSDVLSPLEADEITPFDASISAIHLALNQDSEELYAELLDILNEIRDNYNELRRQIPIRTGNALAGSTNTITLDANASGATNAYRGYVISIVSGDGAGQERKIISYNGTSKEAVVDYAWIVIPDATSGFVISREPIAEVTPDTNVASFPEIIKNTRKLGATYTYSQSDLLTGIDSILDFAELKRSVRQLDNVIRKIEWFEFFQGISLRNSRVSIISGNPVIETGNYRKLSRILVPVDYGVKTTRVRRKTNGYVEAGVTAGAALVALPLAPVAFGFMRRRRYRYIKTDLGIRFVEIRFVDTSILTKYRKNDDPVGMPVLNPDGTQVIEPDPENPARNRKKVVEFETTNPDPIPTTVSVSYQLPHLPFDEELRKLAIDSYGFFDNSLNAGNSNVYDSSGNVVVNFDNNVVKSGNQFIEIKPGYQIFPSESTKNIEDLRGGLDIYKKVQFLLAILNDAFPSRVSLIETIRTLEDQNRIQFGGDSSNFLSWHNYGLSVKIIIKDPTGNANIKEGSADFLKLIDIAETFTKMAKNGDLGTPCNVVWCGRLKTGPDNFVWEFLPIGIEHKDAWKLRDSSYNQIDPIAAHAFVDVVSKKYLITPATNAPTSPYIRTNSPDYINGTRIGNSIFVSPSAINNYEIPSNLPLKDIQEFFTLMHNKFLANGSEPPSNRNFFEWKTTNPISYKQLILFYSLIGNFNIVRSFLGIDYVETFEPLTISAYNQNSVDFVRSYLGEVAYNNIKINIKVNSDSGYISPADGKLYIKIVNVESNQPEGNGNTFGQKQLDPKGVSIVDGGYIVSEAPVLTEKQIKIIHDIIRDSILGEYTTIKESFENLSAGFLYDSFKSGSNAEDFDTLENEFGIIKTQDLIEFDQMKSLYNRLAINSSGNTNLDGTTRGAGVNLENTDGEAVFEKLVSVAQTAGVQVVKKDNSEVILEDIQEEPLEVLVKKMLNKNSPRPEDII